MINETFFPFIMSSKTDLITHCTRADLEAIELFLKTHKIDETLAQQAMYSVMVVDSVLAFDLLLEKNIGTQFLNHIDILNVLVINECAHLLEHITQEHLRVYFNQEKIQEAFECVAHRGNKAGLELFYNHNYYSQYINPRANGSNVLNCAIYSGKQHIIEYIFQPHEKVLSQPLVSEIKSSMIGRLIDYNHKDILEYLMSQGEMHFSNHHKKRMAFKKWSDTLDMVLKQEQYHNLNNTLALTNATPKHKI